MVQRFWDISKCRSRHEVCDHMCLGFPARKSMSEATSPRSDVTAAPATVPEMLHMMARVPTVTVSTAGLPSATVWIGSVTFDVPGKTTGLPIVVASVAFMEKVN